MVLAMDEREFPPALRAQMLSEFDAKISAARGLGVDLDIPTAMVRDESSAASVAPSPPARGTDLER